MVTIICLFLNCKISSIFIIKNCYHKQSTTASFRYKLPITSRYYSGIGTKLSPIFGFAKSSQIQNHLSIKPITQIRCSSCYAFGLFYIQLSFNFRQFNTVCGASKSIEVFIFDMIFCGIGCQIILVPFCTKFAVQKTS